MEGKRGFLLSGSGLRFAVSPRAANLVAGEIDSHESRVEIAVNSVELKQLLSGVPQRNECLISQAASESGGQFISATFRHTWARLDRPKSTQLHLNIDGLCVILDREAWLDLFKFLSGSIIATIRHDMSTAPCQTFILPPFSPQCHSQPLMSLGVCSLRSLILSVCSPSPCPSLSLTASVSLLFCVSCVKLPLVSASIFS